MLPNVREEKDLLLIKLGKKQSSENELKYLKGMLESCMHTLKEHKRERKKLGEKVKDKTLEAKFLSDRVLGLAIRSLEAKLLRRIFSFLDPNFIDLKVNVAFVCKYWRKICSHKSLAQSLARKPSRLMDIGAKPVKGKRSALQNIMRLDSLKGVVDLENHKKSLRELEIELEDEQKLNMQFQKEEEADIRKLEDDLLSSKQRRQRQDELDAAANEFFFKAQGMILLLFFCSYVIPFLILRPLPPS